MRRRYFNDNDDADGKETPFEAAMRRDWEKTFGPGSYKNRNMGNVDLALSVAEQLPKRDYPGRDEMSDEDRAALAEVEACHKATLLRAVKGHRFLVAYENAGGNLYFYWVCDRDESDKELAGWHRFRTVDKFSVATAEKGEEVYLNSRKKVLEERNFKATVTVVTNGTTDMYGGAINPLDEDDCMLFC